MSDVPRDAVAGVVMKLWLVESLLRVLTLMFDHIASDAAQTDVVLDAESA